MVLIRFKRNTFTMGLGRWDVRMMMNILVLSDTKFWSLHRFSYLIRAIVGEVLNEDVKMLLNTVQPGIILCF